MLRGPVGRHALGLFLVAGALLGSSPVGTQASLYDEAIARALRLLPRHPEKILLVDRPNATGLHDGKPNVEAFVIQGGRVVYLVRQGVTLQRALRGPGVFDFALAAIIWHEMAHIDGADEPAAQLMEEQLWKQFILTGLVDSRRGMSTWLCYATGANLIGGSVGRAHVVRPHSVSRRSAVGRVRHDISQQSVRTIVRLSARPRHRGHADVEVLEPDAHIATVSEGGMLHMELRLKRGRGYVSADKNFDEELGIGRIPVDSSTRRSRR